MSSIFTKIINRELPGNFVYETETVAAFLTIAPLSPGHTLVVPKQEVDYWESMQTELFQQLNSVAQLVGQAIKIAYQPARIGLVIAGFEVPHTHIHVFGANNLADFNFANVDDSVTAEELGQQAKRLTEIIPTLL